MREHQHEHGHGVGTRGVGSIMGMGGGTWIMVWETILARCPEGTGAVVMQGPGTSPHSITSHWRSFGSPQPRPVQLVGDGSREMRGHGEMLTLPIGAL